MVLRDAAEEIVGRCKASLESSKVPRHVEFR